MQKIKYVAVPTKLRQEVILRSKGICFWCKKKAKKAELNKKSILVLYDEKGNSFHLDHVKPRSKGGGNKLSNLVLACRDCNLGERRKMASNNKRIIDFIKNINEK